jgi:MFS family permease
VCTRSWMSATKKPTEQSSRSAGLGTAGQSQPAGRLNDAVGDSALDPASAGTQQDVTFGDVLANKHYRNVLAAQFVSNIGTWMEMFAIQMYLAQTTGRLDDQGALGVASQLPVFLLGLIGGIVADRTDRRQMLMLTQVLAGAVALLVAIVTMVKFPEGSRTPIYLLFGLSAINGAVMAFNFPAWQVLTPRLVPRHQLLKAITLNGIQFNMTRILGPAIAGFLLAYAWTVQLGPALTASPITVLLVYNAISFAVVAWVVSTTPKTPRPIPTGERPWDSIVRAGKFILTNRGPRAVLMAQVLLSMLAAPLVRMISLFVIDVYGLSHKAAEAAGGTLLAVQGVGAVIGGLALRYIPGWYPKHHFIPVAVTGLGLSICVFSVTPNLAWGYAAMALCGFFWIWSFNQSWAAMQLLAPEEMRGRVLAIVTTSGFGATALGVFIAGYGGEYLKRNEILSASGSTMLAIAGLAAPLLAAGLVMMIWRVPEVDGLARKPAGSPIDRSLWNAITAKQHRPRVEGQQTQVERTEVL